MRRIIQVVVGLPPSIDGVGDYALRLAHLLSSEHGIESRFIVCAAGWAGPERVEGFEVFRLRKRSVAAFVEVIDEASDGVGSADGPGSIPLLLHLSAYGYDRNAVPLWLLKGLRSWQRSQLTRSVLVTMFHELYAFGPPSRKAFWLSPLQRWLAASIGRISTSAITNARQRALKIVGWDPSKQGKVDVLPVFSSIGEPTLVPPLRDRRPRMVIFGQVGTRKEAYRSGLETLAATCEALEIEEVYDVGPPLPFRLPDIRGLTVRQRGVLRAAEISEILIDSVAGGLSYSSGSLGKSTIFAAYCAHGVLPVVMAPRQSIADGILSGKHYWSLDGGQDVELNFGVGERIATTARAWYAQHAALQQAGVFARRLFPMENHEQ